MTKDIALHQWFNSAIHKVETVVADEGNGPYVKAVPTDEFISFYSSTAVPDDVTLPYGTYTPIFSAWDGEPVSLTVNIWDRTTTEVTLNENARELSEAIGLGGVVLDCDEGKIWLKRGSPGCQNLTDDTDPYIKRRYINVTAEYMTTY